MGRAMKAKQACLRELRPHGIVTILRLYDFFQPK